jgi:DNA-binding MarR family transcriptional regulator
VTAERDRNEVADVLDGLSALLKVSRRARQRWSEDRTGLSAGLMTLLMQIEQASRGDGPGPDDEAVSVSGCRLKDLAALAGLDASTVSRETAHLIALGLVERRSDPLDGRAARLALSDRGRERLRCLRDGALDQLAAACRSWDAADVEAFAAALHRFARDLAEVSAGPRPLLPTPAAPGATETTTLLEASS